MTRERVLELLDCDPTTGVLRWRRVRKVTLGVGSIAGCLDAFHAMLAE